MGAGFFANSVLKRPLFKALSVKGMDDTAKGLRHGT